MIPILQGLTTNSGKCGKTKHRSVCGTFDGHLAFKGSGTLLQCIEIPIDPLLILDGNVPFDTLVLKPQSAAFEEEFEVFGFSGTDTSKVVMVVFTDTAIGSHLPMSPPLDDGPGMWVLVVDSNDPLLIEQAHRVTDGTDILIPEVHLAELTGVFGNLAPGYSPSLPGPDTWSKCLPFARFCYTTVLPLPQATYDALQPQLNEDLPIGALVAINY